MSLDPLTAALELGSTLVDKIWPDPAKAAEEKRKLLEMYQSGELAAMQAQVVLLSGQMDINKIEAAHSSIFVAGWRPFIGWVGGASLAYTGLVEPLLRFIATVSGFTGEFPIIDTYAVVTITMGMLGMGALRSFDKKESKGGKVE